MTGEQETAVPLGSTLRVVHFSHFKYVVDDFSMLISSLHIDFASIDFRDPDFHIYLETQ